MSPRRCEGVLSWLVCGCLKGQVKGKSVRDKKCLTVKVQSAARKARSE